MRSKARPARLSTSRTGLEFTAHGPYKIVAPLFGASAERVWQKIIGIQSFCILRRSATLFGEVFTVAHSHLKSVWVNTALDLGNRPCPIRVRHPGCASSTDRHSSSREGSFSYRCKGCLSAHRAKSQFQRACDQVRKR